MLTNKSLGFKKNLTDGRSLVKEKVCHVWEVLHPQYKKYDCILQHNYRIYKKTQIQNMLALFSTITVNETKARKIN